MELSLVAALMETYPSDEPVDDVDDHLRRLAKVANRRRPNSPVRNL